MALGHIKSFSLARFYPLQSIFISLYSTVDLRDFELLYNAKSDPRVKAVE